MTSSSTASTTTLRILHTSTDKRPVWRQPALGLLALLCCAAIACGGTRADDEQHADAATPPGSQTPASEAAGSEAIGSEAIGSEGFEPITSRSAADDEAGSLPTDIAAADGTEIQAPGLTFHLPAGWQSEPPSSNMRMAQASIPGEAGDGQLTVFYFGPGGGGGVDANIDRWVGQVGLDPGTLPRRIRMDLDGGLVAHWVEVEGTLQPSMMGTGPTEPQPGSRLQGAVIEGPQGPWFFKATGPSATLEDQRDAFFSMLRSLRPSV